MGFLKNVKVSKVSFVRRAANKRKFVLLKSDDSEDDNNNNEEKYTPMKSEVREFLTRLFKSTEVANKTVNELVETVKSQESFKLSDEEIAEVKDFISFQKEITPETKLEPKSKVDNDENGLKKDNNSKSVDKVIISKEEYNNLTTNLSELQKAVATLNKTAERNAVRSFLEKECAFLPADVEETVDIIMDMQATNPKGADKYKETLKKASVIVENSSTFTEIGSSTDDLLKSEAGQEGFELIEKINHEFTELRKSSDTGYVSPDQIVRIVNSFGPMVEKYRVAHILRAKHNAV